MRVLFVQTPAAQGEFLALPGKEVPLSLLYLATYLRESGGHEVRVLDLDLAGGITPHLEEALAEFRPDIVGVTSYTSNVQEAGRIAERVKLAAPQTTTILGGFHASALPEETLREFPAFDLLAFGEGEATLADLVQALERGASIAGIAGLARRENGKIAPGPPRALVEDLDALPFPDRTLVPFRRYVPDPGNYFRLPTTGILFSRGCPFRCTYCSKSVFQHRIRYRSAGNFVDEVEECVRRLDIRDFRLDDEGPTVDPRRMEALCEELLTRGLAVTWNCFSRIDTVSPDLLHRMARAGCYHIIYGLESPVATTQERIHKRIDLARAEDAVRWTRAAGIECKVNFIFGFPWESAEDLEETARFARRLNPDLAQFHLFKPLPGSALYDELAAAGRIVSRNWADYSTTSERRVFVSALSEDDLRRALRRAYRRFYFRPRFVLRRLARLLRHPLRETRTTARGLWLLARQGWVAPSRVFGGQEKLHPSHSGFGPRTWSRNARTRSERRISS